MGHPPGARRPPGLDYVERRGCGMTSGEDKRGIGCDQELFIYFIQVFIDFYNGVRQQTFFPETSLACS